MRIKSILAGCLIMIALFTFSFAPVQAQPDTVEFPPLTGLYQVGRADYDMIDSARAEIFTADENDSREFTITVFYPANVGPDADRAPYVEQALIPTLVEYTGVPALVWQMVRPHAFINAPIVDGEFPVILFSHGSGTPLTAYTGLMEDLASHGYIVVGISHTFDTPAVMLSDGRIITSAEADGSPELESDTPAADEDQLLLAVSAADMRFVLNQLVELNITNSLLANHLDLDQVGAIGHSMGGSAALQATYQDERIRAVVNLDGMIFGDVLDHGLNRPTMIMTQDLSILDEDTHEVIDEYKTEEGEVVVSDNSPNLDVLIETYTNSIEAVLNKAEPGYQVLLPGASHDVYATDMLMLADAFPVFAVPEIVGTLDDLPGARASIHHTVLAFFNTYVAEANSPQLDELTFTGFEVTSFNQD